MPIYVSNNTIDMRVVKDWAKLMRETAEEKGDNLSSVRPFHVYNQIYGEVLEEVRNNTHQGLEFYRMMVRILPGWDFE